MAPVLLAMLAGFGVFSQEAPLPEVRRQEAPTATVSEECNQPVIPDSRRPVTTPIIIAEEEQPPPPPRREPRVPTPVEQAEVSPPSEQATAHQSMAALQRAAANGSYERFAAALANTRLKVAAMPAGADKRAFESALDVYSDMDQIWKYAVTDPMGAFYDNETLPGFFARLAREYPNYPDFIKPYVVRDASGRELYPTGETRQFLEAEAAKRLRGVRLPGPPEPPPVVAERAPTRPAPVTEEPPTEPRPAEARPEPAPPVTRPPTRVRREPPPVREEPVIAEPTVPEPATAAPPSETRIEPDETVTALEPSTAMVQPPPPVESDTALEQLLREERQQRGVSTNILLLIAFGVIAVIAFALLVRAFRSRPPAEATLLPREPGEPGVQEQKPPPPGEAEWMDPETRHWLEGSNKTDKPPN